MTNRTVNKDIDTCCKNIEKADSKETIREEVEKIRGCCINMEPEKAETVQTCCTNIENADSKEKIREEVEKIRGCCV
jgi:transposase